ncbi:GNAT family N-acetyltransferase [Aspergillus chevalieri]|uniref:N-acetyltransferase domain-containing protein n=1 Tax=Aspergillus chevalieri TaxID=182096 RepID=A0A7R7VT90_ASPCH|nr:uncharacterized protein ACHE_60273S [Aspergillus chevalieri]BCR90387.1 hypothetical protein ACHE_60273S [Aspergillus chevalieri]
MAPERPRGPLVSFTSASLPNKTTLPGQTVHLEKLNPDHAITLFPLLGGNDPSITPLWDYMPDGPYPDLPTFQTAITTKSTSVDPFFYAIIDARKDSLTYTQPIGYITLMRMTPAHLTLEIGNVMFSAALQRTTGATEAIYLLLKHAFEDLGYRRVEWKCDALNGPSRRAATRFGFTFEGTFRQHMIVKGRSRDTAWFSVLRDEWEAGIGGGLEGWLEEGNFGEDGEQKRSLREVRDEVARK